MKTTVDLPDSLARRAKEVAREQGTTLRELIDEGLRREIERRTAAAPRRPFRFRTVGGSGLRAGVAPADLVELASGLPPT